ncbi:MAG: hypothetical protein GY724_15720 [Actinomycetia bacterium]|nr:hypothetical protein [Actinomycetes bacterium]MCP4225567.1 hypothetical protein [Actinomycetes bacterium]MCP5033148.1 hypothetical protein [Actinomycetes bacterium]
MSPSTQGTSSTDPPTTDGQGEGMDVYFAVEGGIANLTRSVSIDADGVAQIEASGRSSERTLDAATVDAIRAQLDQSELFDQDRTYKAEGADLQRYEIHYAGHTVVSYDTSVPLVLTEAILLLEEAVRG